MSAKRASIGTVLLAVLVSFMVSGCGGSWKCHYDVTYDYDWSNDVVCRKGLEYERPSPPPFGSTLRDYEDMLNAAE